MVDVLVTGFDPFGGGESNISRRVCNVLRQKKNTKTSPLRSPRCAPEGNPLPSRGDEIEINWIIDDLSVDEFGSKKTAVMLESISLPSTPSASIPSPSSLTPLSSSEIPASEVKVVDVEFSPQVIIHLGQCNSCEVIRIEVSAKNLLDFTIADNSGRMLLQSSDGQMGPGQVIRDGKSILSTSTPLKYFPRHLLEMSVELSNDAGSFVCNETYYRTLSAISANTLTDNMGRTLPVVFLHLPTEEKISLELQVKMVEELAAWMASPHTLTVAGAVLIGDDGKIFSCRRSPEEAFAGGWEIPGGKVEDGESIAECLIREMDEELAIGVEVLKPLGFVRKDVGNFTLELHAWSCRQISGGIDLTVHDASRWLNLNEMASAEWMETDIELIPQIVESLSM